MNSILTNQIVPIVNFDNISNDFVVLEYSTSEKYIKHGAKILDFAMSDIKAKSVVFENGRKFYALFDKQNISESKAFINNAEFSNISVATANIQSIPMNLLIQLFLNSLNNFDTENLKFNNLAGQLYCSNPDWFIRTSSKNGQYIKQLKCINISLDKDCCVSLKTCTFTNLKEKQYLKFRKTKLYDFPVYELVGLSMLKRASTNFSNGFIMKQYEDKKNRISFIDFSNWNKFQQSKCGVLYNVLKQFKKKLNKYIEFNLKEIDTYLTVKFEDKFARLTKIPDKKFCIVDRTIEKDSEFINSILIRLKNIGIQNIVVCDHLNADAYNVVVINNKEFYETNADLTDAHDCKEGYIIQHMTYENFSDAESAVECIIKELQIKQDIENQKVSIVDWEKFEVNRNQKYIKRVSDTAFVSLMINDCGDISHEIFEDDIFNNNDNQNLAEHHKILESSKGKIVEGIISDTESKVSIVNTSFFTLPQIFYIGDILLLESKQISLSRQELLDILNCIESDSKKLMFEISEIIKFIESQDYSFYSRNDILALSKNKNIIKAISNSIFSSTGKVLKAYFRSENIRNKLFSSNLHINYYETDSGIRYFVGSKNEGINTVFPTACKVREIIEISNKIDLNIFNLMAVDFVRLEQLTVLPFPFKYLNEVVKNK